MATREQFGKPLSTFQTVGGSARRGVHRLAHHLRWRRRRWCGGLPEGRDADEDLDVLGYWLASQAPPVMQICHHLHGGMGHGHRLPDGPLLLHDQGPDAAGGRLPFGSSGASIWWERNVHRTDPEQRQLQAELRQYVLEPHLAEEFKAMEADRHNEAYRAVIKRMGSDGKLGVGLAQGVRWPGPTARSSSRSSSNEAATCRRAATRR